MPPTEGRGRLSRHRSSRQLTEQAVHETAPQIFGGQAEDAPVIVSQGIHNRTYVVQLPTGTSPRFAGK